MRPGFLPANPRNSLKALYWPSKPTQLNAASKRVVSARALGEGFFPLALAAAAAVLNVYHSVRFSLISLQDAQNDSQGEIMFEGLFQPMHLLIIFGIALLIFGPKKLPSSAKE